MERMGQESRGGTDDREGTSWRRAGDRRGWMRTKYNDICMRTPLSNPQYFVYYT